MLVAQIGCWLRHCRSRPAKRTRDLQFWALPAVKVPSSLRFSKALATRYSKAGGEEHADTVCIWPTWTGRHVARRAQVRGDREPLRICFAGRGRGARRGARPSHRQQAAIGSGGRQEDRGHLCLRHHQACAKLADAAAAAPAPARCRHSRRGRDDPDRDRTAPRSHPKRDQGHSRARDRRQVSRREPRCAGAGRSIAGWELPAGASRSISTNGSWRRICTSPWVSSSST